MTLVRRPEFLSEAARRMRTRRWGRPSRRPRRPSRTRAMSSRWSPQIRARPWMVFR